MLSCEMGVMRVLESTFIGAEAGRPPRGIGPGGLATGGGCCTGRGAAGCGEGAGAAAGFATAASTSWPGMAWGSPIFSGKLEISTSSWVMMVNLAESEPQVKCQGRLIPLIAN